jgi:hypothetical protein
MIRFYPRPDALIDNLPDPIKKAYRAAEGVLMYADSAALMVAGSRTDLLPQAIGRLRACLPEEEAAVRAAEADLAAARSFVPFPALGQMFAAAHLAAVSYAEAVAEAVDAAAERGNYTRENPGHRTIVGAWGCDGVVRWADHYRDYLAECGILVSEEEVVCPGPEWQAFRKKLLDLLPGDKTEDLQTHMRLEVAPCVKGWKARQEDTAPPELQAPGTTAKSTTTRKYAFDLAIDENSRTVWRGNRTANFGGNEKPWLVLVALLRRYPAFYAIEDLGPEIWNPTDRDTDPEEHTVHRTVSDLRKHLAPIGIGVKHTRGVGYRLEETPAAPLTNKNAGRQAARNSPR